MHVYVRLQLGKRKYGVRFAVEDRYEVQDICTRE
jgi:hypothetical protein